MGKAKQQAKERGVPNHEMENDLLVKLATQALADKQKTYDKKYGTGSTTKRAVDAVTAALQGLAAKDAGQAVVGLASPYLNEQIKKYTGDNKEANLIAHAILGSVEAIATGNNALAGAAAGAGGEAAAMVITHTLYPNKTTDQLTEAEKQNITFLSQLAGGLASDLVGDSTQAVALGGDIAKRAVENNYLSDEQKVLRDKELQECNGKLRCEIETQMYWSAIDIGQDAAFGAGVVASIPEGALETLKGVIEFASHPVETLNALSTLVKEGKLKETVKQSFLDRIETLKIQYEKAGASGAYNAEGRNR